MAGKIEVYGCKVTKSGIRQVELMGGWVGFDAMNPTRQAAVEAIIRPKMTDPMLQAWDLKKHMTCMFTQDAQWDIPESDVPSEVPNQGDDVSDGNDDAESDQGDGQNDDQFSDGSDDKGESDDEADVPPPPGSGMGEDEPVMHSEFDPWAHQVGKAVEAAKKQAKDAADLVFDTLKTVNGLGERVDQYAGDVGLLLEASSNVQKKLDLMNKKLAEVSNGNSGGGSGGVIVRVEIVRPGEPDLPQDGVFHQNFPKLAKLIAGGHHVYLPGPPGSGKSHAAAAVAKTLGWGFGSISLGPTTPESRLMGGMDANGNFHCPAFVEGLIYAEEHPESGFVFCEDELDNGHPGIIATQNSVMANGWITLPSGRTVNVGSNWVVVGCANTYGTGPTAEFSGRNRLDAATLDRFRYLPWDTDKGMEAALVNGILHETPEVAADWLDTWNSARKNVQAHGLKVFVTMRGAVAGATMLAQGWDLFDTYDMVLANKLPEDQAKKISPF
jgi:hypothetical protein